MYVYSKFLAKIPESVAPFSHKCKFNLFCLFSQSMEIIIIVFSVVEQASFDRALELLNRFRSEFSTRGEGAPAFTLIGTKIDLVTDANKEGSVEQATATSIAEREGVNLAFVSCKYVRFR
jgi:hypothetical protein